jgi:hypothetical protein
MDELRTPDAGPENLERAMETQDLSEGDRDEVRRFAEFLRIPRNEQGRRAVSPEMRDWLLGKK